MENSILPGGCIHPPHGHIDVPPMPNPWIHHQHHDPMTVTPINVHHQPINVVHHQPTATMPNPYSFPDHHLPKDWHAPVDHHSGKPLIGAHQPIDSTHHQPIQPFHPVHNSVHQPTHPQPTALLSKHHVDAHVDKHGVDVSGGFNKGNVDVKGNVHNDFHGHTTTGVDVTYNNGGFSAGGHYGSDHTVGGTIGFSW